MAEARRYPKRLIEVDLPIKEISVNARAEKDSRLSPIPSLHVYPAARPLAACRAVLAATLWPDPVDDLCPIAFRTQASDALRQYAAAVGESRGPAAIVEGDLAYWLKLGRDDVALSPESLRQALLRFVATLSRPKAETEPITLETARTLTQVAFRSLRDERHDLQDGPTVLDPFTGGGAIPLEACRLGASAVAGDLNPIAVLINKLLIEFLPTHGREILEHLTQWLSYAGDRAKADLCDLYPLHEDRSQPIAYLWARTVLSEAPDGSEYPIEVPLLRSMWLSRKKKGQTALRWKRDSENHVLTITTRRQYADGTSVVVRQPILELFRPRSSAEIEPGTSRRECGDMSRHELYDTASAS